MNKIPRRIIICCIVLSAALWYASCEVGGSDSSPVVSESCETSTTVGVGETHSVFTNYGLVFQDEFDGNSIDTSVWRFDTDNVGNSGGWGNNEHQYYTGSSDDNAYISDGALVMEAKRETQGGKNYTSARLHTHGTKSFKYGVIEACIKLPENSAGNTDPGTWPAFWMLGDNFNGWGHTSFGGDTEWPSSGEIDIMETNSKDHGYDYVLGTAHFNALAESTPFNQAVKQHEGGSTPISNPTSEYHVYSIVWTSEEIKFYLDHSLYYTFTIDQTTQTEFQKEFFLLLNVAVGGDFVNNPIAANYPQKMYVDWVRAYEYGGSSAGSGSTNELVDAPTELATVPTPNNGIIIYGSSLTAITGVNMHPDWDGGAGTVTGTVKVEGKDIVKYSNLNYQGIEFGSGQDLSSKTNLKMDVWTADNVTYGLSKNRIFVITNDGTENVEAYSDVDQTLGQWTTLIIPLSSFTSTHVTKQPALNNVFQLKIDPTDRDPSYVGKTIYVDNVYFE